MRELQIEIDGGTTNQGFLLELLASEAVSSGPVQTDFVEHFLEARTDYSTKSNWDVAIIAAVIYQYERRYKEELENFTDKVRRVSSPRRMPDLTQEITISKDSHSYEFQVSCVGNNYYHIQMGEHLIGAEYVNWGHEGNP